MFYTKEMIHTEFKALKKMREKRNKRNLTNTRIEYLKTLKEDMIKSPKYFRDISMTTDQLQNIIDDWSHQNLLTLFIKEFLV